MLRRFTIALTLAGFLEVSLSAPVSPAWYQLNREDGCLPLAELHAHYPFLSGAQTPKEHLSALARRAPDAKLEVLIDVFDAERRKSSDVATQEERHVMKHFTRSNAFLLSSASESVEIQLLSEQLCKAIGGLK